MYVKGVTSSVCGFYATLYTEYRFNGKHVNGVKSTLYIEGPSPLQEVRLFTKPPVLCV